MAEHRAHVRHGVDDVARARLTLRPNHGCAFGDAPQRLAEVGRAADERNRELPLVDVMRDIRRRQHFGLVDVVDLEGLQDLRLGEVADAALRHHGDRDGLLDALDHLGIGHACDPALDADVRGHALERHHRDGACRLGDLRLLGVDHVHDHPALEHLGEAALHPHRPELGHAPILAADHGCRQPFASASCAAVGVTVQTRTAFRSASMMSLILGRSFGGAKRRNACSVEAVDASSSAKATVSTFPSEVVARRPPFAANPAMKPTFVWAVVTSLKPFCFRQLALPLAVNGLVLRAPQPATTTASTAIVATTNARRATMRLYPRRLTAQWENPPMEPWSRDPLGRFDEHELESDALRDNPLGDPNRRPLWVYLPPAYATEPERRFPTIYLIQGHTGQLDMWRNRSAFRPNVPELVDRLFGEEGCPPALVVFVDAWTSYGGSQFIDSPGVGRYHTYLCDEVVPFVDERYPTSVRGITGKSSGGYGAMVTPMLRPDLFSGLATHAGDALFELCYLPDFRDAVRALRDSYEGSFEQFWTDFHSRPAFSKGSDFPLLNTYAMAECYSPGELPFDVATGELVPDVWEKWLAWDPVRMVDRYADALRGLRAVYIDSGKRDQFYLDLGAEGFRRALERIGVTDVFFELFDGTHSSIEYRYPIALRYLAERLSPR